LLSRSDAAGLWLTAAGPALAVGAVCVLGIRWAASRPSDESTAAGETAEDHNV
jgi:hypothetical protein